MKRISTKQAALNRKWAPIRRQYVETHPCCVCGGPATDCHEILAGALRQRAFVEVCCWLAVCRRCHDYIQGMQIPNQLALKLVVDPEHFDLVKFHEVWHRPITACTLQDISPFLKWGGQRG